MTNATVSDTQVSLHRTRSGVSFREGPRGGAHQSRGLSQQRLPGTDRCGWHDVLAEFKRIRRQHDDGRSVLEPAELVALADADIAREDGGRRRSGIEHDIEKMQ